MRIDLHTHAKLSKASDFSRPYYEEMLAEARANGLHALALTEHFNTRHFGDVYHSLDAMFPYNGECYEADGLLIFAGMEVDIREKGHILLIGRQKDILALRAALEAYTVKPAFIPFDELMDLAESCELLKIGAHPFRDSTPLHHLSDRQLRRLDAFDLNAKDMYQYGCEANRVKVEAFAARLGKPVTAGSDTHQHLQYGSVYNELEYDCRTIGELKAAITGGRFRAHVSDSLPLKVKASVLLKKLLKRIAVLEADSGLREKTPETGISAG